IKSSNDVNSGEQLNQAYTCVKIAFDKEDYKLDLDKMKSEIVPLRANDEFNTIRLEWHIPAETTDPLTAPCSGGSLPTATDPMPLCAEGAWASAGNEATTPAMLRA